MTLIGERRAADRIRLARKMLALLQILPFAFFVWPFADTRHDRTHVRHKSLGPAVPSSDRRIVPASF
jgi:hypothetical protein